MENISLLITPITCNPEIMQFVRPGFLQVEYLNPAEIHVFAQYFKNSICNALVHYSHMNVGGMIQTELPKLPNLLGLIKDSLVKLNDSNVWAIGYYIKETYGIRLSSDLLSWILVDGSWQINLSKAGRIIVEFADQVEIIRNKFVAEMTNNWNESIIRKSPILSELELSQPKFNDPDVKRSTILKEIRVRANRYLYLTGYVDPTTPHYKGPEYIPPTNFIGLSPGQKTILYKSAGTILRRLWDD